MAFLTNINGTRLLTLGGVIISNLSGDDLITNDTIHVSNLIAVNALCVLSGGTGGHPSMLPALNELCTLQGVETGHLSSLPALNAIDAGLGGTGLHKNTLSALNSINSAIGNEADYTSNLGAYNGIYEVGFESTIQTRYYVDPVNGSDGYDGTLSAPFLTLEHALTLANPGNTIYLLDGTHTLTESLVLPTGGTSDLQLTIRAYTGATPVITGFKEITGWANVSGNIYKKAVTCESAVNMLTFDGEFVPIGRFPKTTYRTYESSSGTTSITDTQLSEVTDYLDAYSQVVIKKGNRYIIDRCNVASVESNTINYTGGSVYTGGNGFGYFIQNSIDCLTADGDWAFINGELYIYSEADPSTHTIKVTTFDNLIENDNNGYITFDGVTFEGANANLFYLTQANGFKLENCTLRYSGGMGVYIPDGAGTSNAVTIDTCTFSIIMDCGIKGMTAAANPVVTDSTFTDIGMIIGMAGNGDGRSTAIFLYGQNPLVSGNTIDNVGFNGIVVRGNNGVVKNNVVTDTVQIKEDGAGIYVSAPSGGATLDLLTVQDNMVIGCGSAVSSQGVNDEVYRICHGIYLDDTTNNVLVTGNTIANCEGQGSMGIYLHNNTTSSIIENDIYNCSYGIQIAEDRRFGHITSGLSVTGNNVLCKAATQVGLFLSSNQVAPVANLFEEMGLFDDNRYCRPVDDSTVILTSVNTYTAPNLVTDPIPRTLANYQAYCPSMDQTSTDSPVDSDGVGALLFDYAGHTAKNVSLDAEADYVTLTDETKSGTIALPAYSSLLLIDKNYVIPLTTGLLTYWDLDETTGAAVDSVSGFNGTATGGVTQTADGITIDADGEYLDCGYHEELNLTTFSFSFWLNLANYTPTRYIMGTSNWTTDRFGVGFKIFNEPGTPSLDDKLGCEIGWSTGKSTFAITTNAVPLETLTHFVLTYDGVNFKTYINGVLDLTRPTVAVPEYNEIPFYIGKVYGNTNTYRGLISRVGIWSAILTPSAALKIYNGGDGMKYADL